MNATLKFIFEWNRKLFPILVAIFIVLVVIKVLKPDISSRLLNLDYKLIFIIISGILFLVDYYLRKR